MNVAWGLSCVKGLLWEIIRTGDRDRELKSLNGDHTGSLQVQSWLEGPGLVSWRFRKPGELPLVSGGLKPGKGTGGRRGPQSIWLWGPGVKPLGDTGMAVVVTTGELLASRGRGRGSAPPAHLLTCTPRPPAGTPVNRIPIMAKQVLDLFMLYVLVTEKGGLVEVINKKLWREITKGLNLPTSITSAAFTLRTQYMKYLYPYECEKRGLSNPNELQAAIDSNRREGRRHSFGGSLFAYSPGGAHGVLSSPKLPVPSLGLAASTNGSSIAPAPKIKKGKGPPPAAAAGAGRTSRRGGSGPGSPAQARGRCYEPSAASPSTLLRASLLAPSPSPASPTTQRGLRWAAAGMAVVLRSLACGRRRVIAVFFPLWASGPSRPLPSRQCRWHSAGLGDWPPSRCWVSGQHTGPSWAASPAGEAWGK
ncbi:AT-rich interactive domain-containing protein 3A [Suricata suricatta]|uniref:AT-rich interactive domain-containing protein 3A n=1 Tax=Suricata suricatta TaxID=37032 RepID=UPI0011559176|nr:AT-rich interactive domain-containing protein 3A [Suricata suricatta]